MESVSEETSKLFVNDEWRRKDNRPKAKKAAPDRRPLGYVDPSVKRREKKAGAGAAKKSKKKQEPYRQIKRENNIAETTITRQPETPKKSQIRWVSGKSYSSSSSASSSSGYPSLSNPDKENVNTPKTKSAAGEYRWVFCARGPKDEAARLPRR